MFSLFEYVSIWNSFGSVTQKISQQINRISTDVFTDSYMSTKTNTITR